VIRGIHHVGLTVTDVAAASARWQRLLGLSPAADDGALLRCAYEDFCVRLTAGERGCVDYIAYELEAGVTLAEAGDRLSDAGTLAVPFELPAGRFGARPPRHGPEPVRLLADA